MPIPVFTVPADNGYLNVQIGDGPTVRIDLLEAWSLINDLRTEADQKPEGVFYAGTAAILEQLGLAPPLSRHVIDQIVVGIGSRVRGLWQSEGFTIGADGLSSREFAHSLPPTGPSAPLPTLPAGFLRTIVRLEHDTPEAGSVTVTFRDVEDKAPVRSNDDPAGVPPAATAAA